MKISKGAFIHVEDELEAYHETQNEIIHLKAEILHGKASTDENVGGGRSSMPSDPTGSTAVMLVSHRTLQHMERVVTVIESIYSQLPLEKQRVIKLKYWSRPQTLTWDGIALELNISRITAIRWRDEIVQAIACRVGWR